MRVLATLTVLGTLAAAQSKESLRLAATVPMPGVEGRIDHLALDLARQRLFVAALGNNSVEVIDLKSGTRAPSLSGLNEPQGLLYLPDNNRLYVANGGDGTVRIFEAASWKLLRSVSLGEDADNIRFDPERRWIYVGYGGGALGTIDEDGNRVGDIRLSAHPESFQIEQSSSRIFVNLPNSRKIAVVDRRKRAVTAMWGTDGPLENFPMALDQADHRLFVVCRLPARLVVLDTETGAVVQKLPAVGDCDDVFYDAARRRIYAIGGEGSVWVYAQQDASHYSEVGRVETVRGARTGLFSAELGRLYVAARRQDSQPAAIRVYDVTASASPGRR